ncbi:MAG: hypothetical protein SFU87_09135 [Chitinophagaceae bacterium]|nr:hypothetical protein [Chitinophagaceae bacterium]
MKQYFFFSILFLSLLSSEQKVHLKVEEIGSPGRKEIKVNKINNEFKLLNANDDVSEYELVANKNLSVKIFQYGGDAADVIKIGKFKFTVAKSINPLIEKDFNPRYLSTSMMETYNLFYKRKKYLIIIAKSSGAAGKAINYSLYQIFDITSSKEIKYYPATSYFGNIKNITDLDKDGNLDFLKVKEKKDNVYEMKSFEICTGTPKNIQGRVDILF